MPRLLIVIAVLVLSMTFSSPVQAQSLWEVKAREILATVVSMRTSAGHGQVPAMANYLRDELLAGGFAPDDIEVELHGETATFIARYRSTGLNRPAPVLLLAHMDVVDADPKDWVLDPFELIEKEGVFYGRGVADNKFGVSLLTTTFLRLKAEGFSPNRDLILVFSGDEESTQNTTAVLVAKKELRSAEYALNTDAGGGVLGSTGEAIAYFMQAAEKTYASFDITVRNPGGHSSRPRPDNAIYQLADALRRVEAYRFPVKVNETTVGFMSAMADLEEDKAASRALRRLAKNPKDKKAANILWQRHDYIGVTRTTCVATQLKAGHAENALPQRASATINCRIFPDVDPEEVRQALARAAGEHAEVTLMDKAFLASASPLREDVMEAVSDSLEQRAPGIPIIPSMSAGYTDGSFFRGAGVPTYGVSGVFSGSEGANAHGLNEHVPVASLATGLEHWRTLIHAIAR